MPNPVHQFDDAIANAVSASTPEALDLLRRLIQTPCVTGDEGSASEPSSAAGLLWASLAELPGAERHADTVEPNRDNIIACLSGGDGRVVILDAHYDTVPTGDPSQWLDGNPFSAADGTVTYLGNDRIRLEAGKVRVERPVRRRLGRMWEARGVASAPVIYGRGSFDNKGPVAVAWLATAALARALAATGQRLAGTLVCGFTVDEEDGMAGVKALAGGPGCWLDRQGLL
ncbi:MAG: M20/M25/M40 family metallo-hydrolase, partial [Thermomicrobiales bacterium]